MTSRLDAVWTAHSSVNAEARQNPPNKCEVAGDKKNNFKPFGHCASSPADSLARGAKRRQTTA